MNDGIKLSADLNGYWKGDTLHINISLYDNDNLVKLKSVSITEDELGKLEIGESVEGYWVEGSKVYFPTGTNDKRMVDSSTDVGIEIDDLIALAENSEVDDYNFSVAVENPDSMKTNFSVARKLVDYEEEEVAQLSSYPVDDERWQHAIKNAENFNMKPPDSASKTTLHLPGPGEPIAQIGKVAGIIYMSDKEGLGEGQQYLHEMKKPYPILALAGTNKKPVYIIFGGRTYISEPGDDSGEAPGWMID